MTPDDLARLHTVGFDEGRPWSAEEFESLLASPTTFLVTNAHAFALGRAMGGEAELLTLVCHPAHRRKGLGRDALLGFEMEAAARHAVSAFLEVASDNTAARGLYAAAGYELAGTRPGYYKRGTGHADALLLSKVLRARRG
ncbi:MAG: GNAT family N-acetyltransferase [Pseudomonadota bacterium]